MVMMIVGCGWREQGRGRGWWRGAAVGGGAGGGGGGGGSRCRSRSTSSRRSSEVVGALRTIIGRSDLQLAS